MAKPYDAATKQFVEIRPQDWLAFLGLPGRSVEIIEADLSTVTAEADRVLRVDAPNTYLTHLEFQASYDASIARRLLRYNVLLHYKGYSRWKNPQPTRQSSPVAAQKVVQKVNGSGRQRKPAA